MCVGVSELTQPEPSGMGFLSIYLSIFKAIYLYLSSHLSLCLPFFPPFPPSLSLSQAVSAAGLCAIPFGVPGGPFVLPPRAAEAARPSPSALPTPSPSQILSLHRFLVPRFLVLVRCMNSPTPLFGFSLGFFPPDPAASVFSLRAVELVRVSGGVVRVSGGVVRVSGGVVRVSGGVVRVSGGVVRQSRAEARKQRQDCHGPPNAGQFTTHRRASPRLSCVALCRAVLRSSTGRGGAGRGGAAELCRAASALRL